MQCKHSLKCILTCLLDVFLICLSFLDLHIKETEDNEAVVSTLIELHRLLTSKHLPAVRGWIQVSTDTSGSLFFMYVYLYVLYEIYLISYHLSFW